MTYSYEDFCRGIVERDGPGCWVARLLAARQGEMVHGKTWAEDEYRPWMLGCDGPMDGHHTPPKQVIKRAVATAVHERQLNPQPEGAVAALVEDTLPVILADPRLGVAACRRHHDLVGGKRIRLLRSDVPEHVEEVAEALGLGWWLDREYGARA